MTGNLAPLPWLRFCDNNGRPLAGGQLFTYQAGTTTPASTYTDSTFGTPNTNPVILNARGEASVWLEQGQSYKLVLQDAQGYLIWTQDDIAVDAANGMTPVENAGSTPLTMTWNGSAVDVKAGTDDLGPIVFESELQNELAPINGQLSTLNGQVSNLNNQMGGVQSEISDLQAASGQASLGQNGWFRSAGMLIQWGLTAPIATDQIPTIGFPIAFSGTPYGVVATQQADGITSGQSYSMGAQVKDNASFVLSVDQGGPTGSCPVFWIAIGPG